MGMRAAQWWRPAKPKGLGPAKIGIMWDAAWSSEDDTVFLPFGKGGLVEKTKPGRRSLERHLPKLGKLAGS